MKTYPTWQEEEQLMNVVGDTMEIYFSDLKQETQEDILDTVGISNPKELNWDVVPLATIDIPEEA